MVDVVRTRKLMMDNVNNRLIRIMGTPTSAQRQLMIWPQRRQTIACALLVMLLMVELPASQSRGDDSVPAGSIEARDVFLRVKESAEVPALERGQLKEISVQPSDTVESGQILALLDDVESRLHLELARLELQIAEKDHSDSVTVDTAKATLEEGKMLLSQAGLESEVARLMASSDISINQALSGSEASRLELERAIAAREEFSSSVSEQQLARLTLARDQDVLKLELARHNQSLDVLRSRSKESLVLQQKAAVLRLEHSLVKSERELETAGLKIRSLQKQVAIAEERVERRKMRTPFPGVVVEKMLHAGEWVEIGESVLRIIRLDTLYVEGYVEAKRITPNFRGRKVIVLCSDSDKSQKIDGVIVFVSPEIDSVSQQVQVRAEISNPEFLLRPGQPAQMWIKP